jgi:hypothetical protein
MKTSSSFCPCSDHNCAFNPINHDEGCNLCIDDSLKCREIPKCFFMKVNSDISLIDDWSFESFAAFVRENEDQRA